MRDGLRKRKLTNSIKVNTHTIMSEPPTNLQTVHCVTTVGIFIVIWSCWLVFHNEAHLHMHLWRARGRWLARVAHRRRDHDVLGQFPKWHNSQLLVDHWDFGLTQGTCQSTNWHTIWFRGGRIHYISCINAMNPMRCLKFKGHWCLVYKQFKSGRLDTSRLETIITGPSATELFQFVT